MRRIFLLLALISFSTVAACGGGGGGETPPPAEPTAATVTLSISGALPADTLIGGIDVTVSLPSNVTVKSTTAPVADAGVVVASGLAGSDAATMGAYTPAAGASPATVRVLLAAANGLAAGEFATMNCDIAGSAPQAAAFTIQSYEVKDLNGAVIPGLTAGLAVTLR